MAWLEEVAHHWLITIVAVSLFSFSIPAVFKFFNFIVSKLIIVIIVLETLCVNEDF